MDRTSKNLREKLKKIMIIIKKKLLIFVQI